MYDEETLPGHKGLAKVEWQTGSNPGRRKRQSDGKA